MEVRRVGFMARYGVQKAWLGNAELGNERVDKGGFGLGSSVHGMACKDGFCVEKMRDDSLFQKTKRRSNGAYRSFFLKKKF